MLHNDAFVGAGTRSVRKSFVGLGFAERTASGLGLGGIWKSCTHLTDKILKPRANVPIPLGRGFVEGDAPPDGITTDQLLGHFTFCCQVEFGTNNDYWYRLMEGKSVRGRGGDEIQPSR